MMAIFLETERLILKEPEHAHLADLIALRADPEVMRFIGSNNGQPQSAAEVEIFLKAAIDYQKKYGFGFCSVFEKDSGAFVGQAGLFHLGFCEEQPEIELGYRLHKKFWGLGYATELARALIHWGFENLPNDKFLGVVFPENIRSCRVLEKAGMTYMRQTKYREHEVACYEIYRNDLVELVDYDDNWPMQAEHEIKKLYQILPNQHIIDIQHVGSTAIPGMTAKPIIDILIAVDKLDVIKPIAIDILQSDEYVYWAENPDLTRMFFVKGMPPFGVKRTHHIHIVEMDSKHWLGKKFFRDYLTAHPEKAREYAQLKIDLAKKYKYDREQYTQAKSEFVTMILEGYELHF
jgi:GrpB-like predicted nucleotidyltransferase (UPF0157 family)